MKLRSNVSWSSRKYSWTEAHGPNEDGPVRKKRKADNAKEKESTNHDRAVSPSLPRLSEDCASAILPFLDLGERARLAATCRILRTNERESAGNIRSRNDRTEELVERVRRMAKDDASLGYSDRNDETVLAFLDALEEFDSAGAMGAPGLLELLPIVAPLSMQLQRDSVFQSGDAFRNYRNVWRHCFVPAAVRWFRFLDDAKKIAEDAAAYLEERGSPTDLKMAYHPELCAGQMDEERAACERECVETFKLGLLGDAGKVHIKKLLRTMCARPPDYQTIGTWAARDFENAWFEGFESKNEVHSKLTLSRIAFDSFLTLKPSLTSTDIESTLEFLDTHVRESSNTPEAMAIPTLLLSNLWELVQHHSAARKTLMAVPVLEPDATMEGTTCGFLLVAQCRLVGAAKSTKHYGFLVRVANTSSYLFEEEDEEDGAEDEEVGAAIDALRSIVPLLSQSQREKVVKELRRIACRANRSFHTQSMSLFADIACTAHNDKAIPCQECCVSGGSDDDSSEDECDCSSEDDDSEAEDY